MTREKAEKIMDRWVEIRESIETLNEIAKQDNVKLYEPYIVKGLEHIADVLHLTRTYHAYEKSMIIRVIYKGYEFQDVELEK